MEVTLYMPYYDYNDYYERLYSEAFDDGIDYLKYNLLAKILKVNLNNPAVPAAPAPAPGPAPAPVPAPGPDTSLSLTVNGSSAANDITNKTKVVIQNAVFDNDLVCAEDAKENIRILLSKRKLGVISDTTFFLEITLSGSVTKRYFSGSY